MTIQKTQILLLVLFMFTQLGLTKANFRANPEPTIINKCDFRSEMRKVWEDHITWMRSYVVDHANNSPSLRVTTERVLKNQIDIGNTIKPFYGEERGKGLTTFLINHVTLTGKLITDLKNKDRSAADKDKEEWFQNADRLAEFLNQLNLEFWPLEAVTFLLHDHLSLTLRQIEAQLNNDWHASIEAYEKIHEEVLQIADAYAYGIYKMFPEKFAE